MRSPRPPASLRLLLLPSLLLLLGAPAAAQPWAAEGERLAARQALAAAARGRWLEADSVSLAADPLARKIITWLRVQTRGAATAPEVAGFLLGNRDWPMLGTIALRAEEALAADPDDSLVLRYFRRMPSPRTLDGARRLAEALERGGRGAEAAPMLRAAWREAAGDAAAESAFLASAAGTLTPEDHARRFDRLALQRETAAATRVVPLLDPGRAAAAQARLALLADRPDAETLVPAGAAREIGLLHDLARWLRRRDRDAEAAAVWREATPLQHDLPPEATRAIWTERQVLSRKLLRLGDATSAYAVAAAHGQAAPGEPRQEGEFLAGFIALRRLNDPARALAHFIMVSQDSRSVITRARSLYWQGRAHAAAGDAARARQAWQQAAELPHAFYGQLAGLMLGDDGAELSARIAAVPSPAASVEQAEAFGMRELVRAVATLADLGDTQRARTFLLRLEELSPDAADRWLIARLAVLIGRTDHAVWVARRAGADGVLLPVEGWPTPYSAPQDGEVEPALVFAISRQESNFETTAVSSSNARGLMQLLPATAAGVARRLGIPHQPAMLTSNPGHNLRLGAAYVGDMLARFDGALPLAAAAYNAGPSRVTEWLGTYGDPRTGTVDMLDWIEQIPFSETRNYVQRVIENVAIYRARIPGSASLPHPMARWIAAP
jgi:soluble lytic murein transglycosylase